MNNRAELQQAFEDFKPDVSALFLHTVCDRLRISHQHAEAPSAEATAGDLRRTSDAAEGCSLPA